MNTVGIRATKGLASGYRLDEDGMCRSQNTTHELFIESAFYTIIAILLVGLLSVFFGNVVEQYDGGSENDRAV